MDTGPPISRSAQTACARTNGSGSLSEADNTGIASLDPQSPSATHTLRANPARPARRIGEPRASASHAPPSSAVSSSAISDGERVPGCNLDAPGSSWTPNGASPGPRAANAGSDVACEKRCVNGQTSWDLSHLSRYLVPLRCGQYLRRERDQ